MDSRGRRSEADVLVLVCGVQAHGRRSSLDAWRQGWSNLNKGLVWIMRSRTQETTRKSALPPSKKDGGRVLSRHGQIEMFSALRVSRSSDQVSHIDLN